MPLLIDTYNVLHTTGVLPPELATTEIAGLVELLHTSRYRDETITLVCDGVPTTETPAVPPTLRTGTTRLISAALVHHIDNHITVRYAGKGKSADDLIDQLVRVSTAPRRVLVVSSDNAVIRSARRRRCKTMTSQEFQRELADDAGMPLPRARGAAAGDMSESQVDHWLEVFDVDEQQISESIATPEKQPSPPTPTDDRREQPAETDPMIPSDLIEQAEQLWQRQSKKRSEQ